MSVTDVTGRERPGMFQVIEDPATGTTFTPTSGRGHKTQFKVAGPEATGDPATIVSRTANPNHLRWEAESQGAIKPTPMDFMVQPRQTKP